MTIIEITNNLQDVLSARRIILLTSGSIAFDGPPEAFLQSPTGVRWASLTEGTGSLAARLTTQGVLSRAPTSMRDIAEVLINIIKE
jgi:ABC-type multidrug transport system ATPase subunit